MRTIKLKIKNDSISYILQVQEKTKWNVYRLSKQKKVYSFPQI